MGINTQEVFVMLGTVNSGKKNFVKGSNGSQSTTTMLPVNGTSGEEKAAMVKETSRTETDTSPKVIESLMAGSSSFKDQKKPLEGLTASGWICVNVEDHFDSLNVACTDATTDTLDFFNSTNTFNEGNGATFEGPIK
jgi:hypothetical protein